MSALEPLLTRTMQPVIEAIGYDAAITLVSQMGGTRPWISAAPTPLDRVSRVIGQSAAQALAASVGVGYFVIPKCRAWLVARRDEEIITRRDGCESVDELALRFNLDRRTIFRILAAAGPGPVAMPRTDLFTESENL